MRGWEGSKGGGRGGREVGGRWEGREGGVRGWEGGRRGGEGGEEMVRWDCTVP